MRWGLVAQLAAEADTVPAPGIDLAQYGAIGVILAALLWFAKHAYDREAERADRLEEENSRLRQKVEDDIIPLLTRAMDALRERDLERHRFRDPPQG